MIHNNHNNVSITNTEKLEFVLITVGLVLILSSIVFAIGYINKNPLLRPLSDWTFSVASKINVTPKELAIAFFGMGFVISGICSGMAAQREEFSA